MHAQNISRDHIQPCQQVSNPPDLELLLAVRLENTTRLFKWTSNYVRMLARGVPAAIGTGVVQTVPLLREHRFSALGLKDMTFFAVRMMQKAKRLAQGCGGKTRVMALMNEPAGVTFWTTYDVERMERFADMLDKYLINPLMYLVITQADDTDEAKIDHYISEACERLKKMRIQYVTTPTLDELTSL